LFRTILRPLAACTRPELAETSAIPRILGKATARDILDGRLVGVSRTCYANETTRSPAPYAPLLTRQRPKPSATSQKRSAESRSLDELPRRGKPSFSREVSSVDDAFRRHDLARNAHERASSI